MSSSTGRAQVEPLPALIAVAVFAVALSMYGTTLEAVPLAGPTDLSDATVDRAIETISEGTVVRPDRLDRLEGRLPDGTTVVVRAAGRQWRWGPEPAPDDPFVVRNVLVSTANGAVPGVVRVSS